MINLKSILTLHTIRYINLDLTYAHSTQVLVMACSFQSQSITWIKKLYFLCPTISTIESPSLIIPFDQNFLRHFELINRYQVHSVSIFHHLSFPLNLWICLSWSEQWVILCGLYTPWPSLFFRPPTINIRTVFWVYYYGEICYIKSLFICLYLCTYSQFAFSCLGFNSLSNRVVVGHS